MTAKEAKKLSEKSSLGKTQAEYVSILSYGYGMDELLKKVLADFETIKNIGEQ